MTRGSMEAGAAHPEPWAALELSEWRPTRDTLHMWTQIVGKVKLALAPPQNHWWQVPLYVSSRGLTTAAVPCGDRTLEILFDLVDHDLLVTVSDGGVKAMPLVPRSVASFYQELMSVLRALAIPANVWPMPVEVQNPIPFDRDETHSSYDADAVQRFFRALTQADAALRIFAGRFQGKQSPVHFFWGSFDLACTRFSGRPAPERPGADRITREAYSQEVMSFGFWPGGDAVDEAAFYACAAPEPAGFREAALRPAAARYVPELNEFILPYAAVRAAESPRESLLDFFQSAYEVGSTAARWDRTSLDRAWAPSPPGGAAEHPPVHPGS
jgi:Family of unknown function (DUF5996)